MSLKHVILGFVDMTPLSGYDLKNMFDSSVQFYWSDTHTQIYRTLDEMLREGLVNVDVIQQTERPNKKVYSLLPSSPNPTGHAKHQPACHGHEYENYKYREHLSLLLPQTKRLVEKYDAHK